MNASERVEFAELVSSVMAYYKQETSPFVVDIWWQACQHYEFEQVRKALTKHATDPERGQFAPKVADIVRQLSGTPTDKAQQAWAKAYAAIGRAGPWQDVVFDDPVIHSVIDTMGGWVKFANVSMDELSYTQHRFMESYRVFFKNPREEYPKVLRGARSPDDEYDRKGLALPAPIVIGIPEIAALVMAGKQISYRDHALIENTIEA
jgi:hypothetical protein